MRYKYSQVSNVSTNRHSISVAIKIIKIMNFVSLKSTLMHIRYFKQQC